MEGQLPTMNASFSVSIKGEPDVHYTFDGEVPKEIMDDYEKIIGNGAAKVTVAMDMSHKDFGTGASAMCSVSLSCNQDQATIARAADIAAWAAKQFVVKYRAEADMEIQRIIEEKRQQAAGLLPGTPYTNPPPQGRYG